MKAKAKPSATQPILVVDSEVVRQIRQHARSSGKTEVCGILIGQDRDQRIEVAACIEGQNADEAGAHVTFTQNTWEHIYAVKDKKYPNERIVGWYHSHPGFGIFLSDHDTFIHKNFFSSPGQVAWVFDPHSDEEGCFGWVGNRIERLTRIAVVDRRGGEPAEGSEKSKSVTGDGADLVPERVSEKREATRIKIGRLEGGESSGGDESALERLVFKVFFYLSVLAVGFSLAYFLFPRMVLVPVIQDPRTGQLIDLRTGEVIAEPRQPDHGNTKDNPSGSTAGSTSGNTAGNPSRPEAGQPDASGKKGDHARP
ncbi:MAG TPA: Mov34/MPN/PAD-1 family protein [Candidatus Sulfotelmatobacter sp.]|nr:Mov34/MPN/PAD-1 family protein [Candidatus Sulfotelmatobacter sp.]